MAGGRLAWWPLPLSPSPGLPMLLVSADVGTASYTVRVTDMANMWTESLDRKAICMRAWSQNTSIDPSDTPENMARFLAGLASALDPSQPGHDETSLTLSPAATADAGEDGLTLRITCALPGLAPLKWPTHLRKSPPSGIATDLVLPLVQAQYAKKRELESLLQALSHKDAVIAKLSDKLEAMGTGLEHVFTALSGRRKVTRSVADDKVRGLAPFDQRKWKAELKASIEDQCPSNTSDLVRSVFERPSLEYGSIMEIDRSPALDSWWHDLKGTLPLAHPNQTGPAPHARRTPSPPTCANSAQDDEDFQLQSTPPHLKSAQRTKAASDTTRPGPDDASTAGEDDDEPTIPDSNTRAAAYLGPAARQSESEGAPARLGAIDDKRYSAPPRSLVPEARGCSDKEGDEKQHAGDSETASEASKDDDNGDATASGPKASPPPPSRHVPTMTAPKKGGLGKIGGGAPKTRGADKSKSPSAEEATRETDGARAHSKLGVIGNKTGDGLSSRSRPAQADTGRGRSLTRQEGDVVEDEPRETSQERADGKRQELKRELKRRAAAGPAKKKRRF